MAWRKQAAAIWREIRHLIAQLTPQGLPSFMGEFRQEIVPSSVASGLPVSTLRNGRAEAR